MDQGGRRLLTLVVAIAVALLVVVGLLLFWNYPANAAPKPKPSPSPTPEEQRLIEFNTVASYVLEVEPELVVAASGCTSRQASYTAYNNFGVALWTWNVKVSWCYGGGIVLDKSVTLNRWGTIYSNPLNLWSYDGYGDLVKGPSTACWDGGCTYSYTRAYGRFHFCVTWYCQYAYPWGAITARGDGTSTIGSGV